MKKILPEIVKEVSQMSRFQNIDELKQWSNNESILITQQSNKNNYPLQHDSFDCGDEIEILEQTHSKEPEVEQML